MAHWTEDDIADQTDRVAVVTGGNSGIGWEAARALAQHGARVVLACRTRSKADDARARMLAVAPKADVSVVDLDLASLDSIASAAAELSDRFDRIDLLINNAGVMATPRSKTADGFEMQFGTNHLGHFALTGLLLPTLLATAGARVVNISSLAHRMGRIHFDDLQSEQKYSAWGAYGQSKLANLLFTFELQRKLAAAGAECIAVAAHPGVSTTNLTQSTGGFMGRMATFTQPVLGKLMQGADKGALPTLLAALDPSAQGGEYYGPGGFMEQRGYPEQVESSDRSKDVATAAQLWQASVDLTGVDYGELWS